MTRKMLFTVWVITLTFISLACGSLQVGVVTPTTQQESDQLIDQQTPQEEVISPTEEIPTPTPEPDFSYLWTEYRDAQLGYGVAIPVHWVIFPSPSEGEPGAMVAASYDEAYFMAHSTKGWWNGGEAPVGAIKVDFVSLKDEYPDLDLTTAISDILGQDELTVVTGTQPALFNGHDAVLVTVARPDQPEDTQTSVAFRLSNGYLLLVAPYWKGALESPDVQTILNSIAFPGEAVVLPKNAPQPPLSDTPADAETPTSDQSVSSNAQCNSGYFGTPEEVVEAIQYNLEIGNYYPFSYLIGDPFVIGYWRSEGVSLPREQAFADLQENFFPAPDKATFTLDPVQFPELDGMPLDSIWGPDADVVANIYSTGWKPDGQGEAILAVARCSENGFDTYYWYGMLYAMNGFQ